MSPIDMVCGVFLWHFMGVSGSSSILCKTLRAKGLAQEWKSPIVRWLEIHYLCFQVCYFLIFFFLFPIKLYQPNAQILIGKNIIGRHKDKYQEKSLPEEAKQNVKLDSNFGIDPEELRAGLQQDAYTIAVGSGSSQRSITYAGLSNTSPSDKAWGEPREQAVPAPRTQGTLRGAKQRGPQSSSDSQ